MIKLIIYTNKKTNTFFHNFFLYIKMTNKYQTKKKSSEKKHAKDTKIFLKKKKKRALA